MLRSSTLLIVAGFLVSLSQSGVVDATDEAVTIYPTYGYQLDGEWLIPMRLWVHERRTVAELGARKLAAEISDASPREIVNFRSRIVDFLADSESREDVVLAFDHDPDQQQIQLRAMMNVIPATTIKRGVSEFDSEQPAPPK